MDTAALEQEKMCGGTARSGLTSKYSHSSASKDRRLHVKQLSSVGCVHEKFKQHVRLLKTQSCRTVVKLIGAVHRLPHGPRFNVGVREAGARASSVK